MKKSPPTCVQELRTALAMLERSEEWTRLTARVALFLGLASLAAAVGMLKLQELPFPDLHIFCVLWAGVFAASAVWAVFLHHSDKSKGNLLDGMDLAIRAFFPFWLMAGFITILIVSNEGETLSLAIVWSVAHGLSLVAQRLNLPPPVIRLGWAFLLAGCAAMTLPITALSFALDEPVSSSFVMGATFGLLHLVYAAIYLKLRGWKMATAK